MLKLVGLDRAATMLEGGQELYQLLTDISNGSLGDPNAEMLRSLNSVMHVKINQIEADLKNDGVNRTRVKQVLTTLLNATKSTIKKLSADESKLLEAIRNPDSFADLVKREAVALPEDSDENMQILYKQLLDVVATEFLTLTPGSPNFNRVALIDILRCFPRLTDQIARLEQHINEQFNGMREDAAAHYQDLKEDLASMRDELRDRTSNSHPLTLNNEVWGSRPHPLKHWIERNPKSGNITLHEAIFHSGTNDNSTLCVLIGPAGSGKTRLAASIADRCQANKWSLVAWINAESDEIIKNQIIAISEEKFGLHLKPNECPEIQFNRALSSFPAQKDDKILIILDNVENSESLYELLPKTPNVHVIATTRHGGNWSHQQGWLPFYLRAFSREESIQLLTKATLDDDKATANQIAQLLDDLPLAVGRAANTCTWLGINKLRHYHSMLEEYPTEKVLDSSVATRDKTGVISALQIAGSSALERIIDPTIRDCAENILGALCYLSEYGIPVHWLKDEGDLFSMCAYTELIDSSLIEETTDGTTACIHRLQAHAMRLYWTPGERDKVAESASAILTRQLTKISADSNHERVKKETRHLIEQVSTMSNQPHSHFLFKHSEVQEAIFELLKYPLNIEFYYESLTLYQAVVLVATLTESDCRAQSQLSDSTNSAHERLHRIIEQFEQAIISAYFSWTFTESELIGPQFALAKAHEAAGHLSEAVAHYAKLVDTCAAIDGPAAPFTMTLREHLQTGSS